MVRPESNYLLIDSISHGFIVDEQSDVVGG